MISVVAGAGVAGLLVQLGRSLLWLRAEPLQRMAPAHPLKGRIKREGDHIAAALD